MVLTQTLRDEHQVILRVLSCFETAIHSVPSPDQSAAATFGPFVEFFRDFADAWHHDKEEGCLFPALERAGLPRDGGPIGCMLEEHDRGRAHVKAIALALEAAGDGDADALSTIMSEGEAYIDLLRAHITKEDHVLFEMADDIIRADDAARVTAEFIARESDAAYVELSTKGHALAERLIVEYADAVASSGVTA
jgi:hemerythrin-like domain-containing protein